MAGKFQIKKRFSLVERENIVDKASRCLWADSGEIGRQYLEKRGISQETSRSFRLGYIPDYVAHQLRGRIILPLYDPSGNLIAIGSRDVNSKGFLPVYWHESYEKSFYLYGMNVAHESIRKHQFSIVCEGQFDVLQLHNHGIKNVVGLCGNKMSDVQMSVIQRYADEIILMLDSDENKAGQAGAEKILSQSSSFDYNFWDLHVSNLPVPISLSSPLPMASRNITSVTLPGNCDPDEFVLKNGVDELKKIVRNKRSESYDNNVRHKS